jgi:3-oxoacyl-[acyl-carrier protein] reductase
MELGIEGRTAAVAAGSAGLGLGAARALVQNGVRVVLCGRNEQRVNEAAKALGPLATPLVADVGTVDGAIGFIEAARNVLGRVDIVIANAGGPPPGTFASTPMAAYLPAIELSMLSTIAMCQAAVPDMQTNGWGRIVAITSISVRQPIANLLLSNTARAGLTGFLKTLSTEVASSGITVNSVQPGMHATERITKVFASMTDAAAGVPAGSLGDPDDFGQVVAFLCSQQARFITGAAIPVDGGSYAGLQ